MPLVQIEILKGRSRERKKALLDAVHSSLVEAFKIPEKDRHQRITEYEAGDFEYPQGKSENFTIITLTVFPGRSLEAKKKLYQNIVAKCREIGIEPFDIFINLLEPPLENWGIRGGHPATEINFEFEIKV